jgi:hypothetical protein
MTDYQRQLFSEMLDLNYELSVGDFSLPVKQAIAYYLVELNKEMEEDMGKEEWKKFKENGRRMFQPA